MIVASCLVLLLVQGGALCVEAAGLDLRPGMELAGIAKYIPDGDTIILQDGTSVRLLGIDAPETAHGKSKAQYYSDQARDTLKSLAGLHTLRIVPGPTPKDKYGRILAMVYLPSGVMLNEELLRRGCVFYYPHPRDHFHLGSQFLEMQQAAMKKRAGAWARVLGMPSASEAYVGNRNSLRFFPVDSKQVSRILKKNRVRFKGLEAAFQAGYAPARATTPWPLMGNL